MPFFRKVMRRIAGFSTSYLQGVSVKYSVKYSVTLWIVGFMLLVNREKFSRPVSDPPIKGF